MSEPETRIFATLMRVKSSQAKEKKDEPKLSGPSASNPVKPPVVAKHEVADA